MSEEAFRIWFPDATYAGDICEGWDGCWEARDQEIAELRALLAELADVVIWMSGSSDFAPAKSGAWSTWERLRDGPLARALAANQPMYEVTGRVLRAAREDAAKIAELRAVLREVLDHETRFRTEWNMAYPNEAACHAVVSENIPREAALRERIRAALGEGSPS